MQPQEQTIANKDTEIIMLLTQEEKINLLLQLEALGYRHQPARDLPA